MKKVFFAAFFFVTLFPTKSFSFALKGYVSVEERYFFNKPLYAEQKRDSFSSAISPELFFTISKHSSLTITPFYRYDSADENRTHGDLREFLFAYIEDKFEFKAGVGKVFWGVTESRHLVDIINQTDYVESPDGEEKLGEPMINLTFPLDSGAVDLFLLPYFRERTFPGSHGRLRNEILVDTKNSLYSSDEKERHLNIAGRFFFQRGSLDFAVSHFYGTSREPEFVYNSTDNKLRPLYKIINQSGVETLYVTGPWIFKLESIYRSISGGDDFFAATSGFEYTFSGNFLNGKEIGALMEGNYDGQYDDLNTPFNKDVMVGIRVAMNDIEGTEFLAGYSRDIEKDSASIFLEGSSRLQDYLRLRLEGFIIMERDRESIMYELRDDSYVNIAIEYYF